jgi:cytochrome c oxidase subunit I+III
VFFASLLFGLAFLSLVSPGPALPAWQPAFPVMATGVGGLLLLLALGTFLAGQPAMGCLAGAAAANLFALVTLVALALWQLPDPTRHAGDAVRAAIAAYAGLHVAVALLFSLFALDEARRGALARGGSLHNGTAWQRYTLAVAALSVLAIWAQGGGG